MDLLRSIHLNSSDKTVFEGKAEDFPFEIKLRRDHIASAFWGKLLVHKKISRIYGK
jgi:hypothetical protein